MTMVVGWVQPKVLVPALLISVVLCLLAASPARAAQIDLIRQFGSPSKDAAEGVTVDGAGNIYVIGSADAALPGQTSAGARDGFLRKYDASGQELFTRQFGTAAADEAEGVAVDGAGNIHVVGFTDGALPGQIYLGRRDAFIRRYSSTGTEVSTTQFGTTASDAAFGVTVDPAGAVYVTGYTSGRLPGQARAGGPDAFVRKYSPDGQELFTRQFGTPLDDVAQVAPLDAAGNFYVSGHTDGTLPGQQSAGGRDAYVRKYNAAGRELFTRQFGTPAADNGRTAAVDPGTGGAYVVGHGAGVFPGQQGAGGTDTFVRFYDASGREVFTRQFGSTANDEGEAVATDASGHAYIVGVANAALPGQRHLGGQDAYAYGLNRDGNNVFAAQYGTVNRDEGDGVAVDGAGRIYTSGLTGGRLSGQIRAGNLDALLVRFAGN